MSYVLAVILFVTYQYCSSVTPCDKNKPYVKNLLIFFFYILILDIFLFLEVLYERSRYGISVMKD